MEDKLQISYWVSNTEGSDNILTTKTTVAPKVGEVIHINTQMDKYWYDTRFPNKKLFVEGVRGNFIVTEIKRYYRNHDYVNKQVVGDEEYHFPSQYTIEEFEVYLDEVD